MNNEKNKKELKNELDSFLDEEVKNVENLTDSEDVEVIIPKTGLVERVEKTLIVQDGRQLLKEETYGGTHNIF